MILINFNGVLLLINYDPTKMGKDLPEGTLVFCLDEFYSGYPEIRLSTKTDNCYGCQPLIGINDLIGLEGCKIKLCEGAFAKLEMLPDVDLPYHLIPDDFFNTIYTLDDIKKAFLEGARTGLPSLMDGFLSFMDAVKRTWICELEYPVSNLRYPLIVEPDSYEIGKLFRVKVNTGSITAIED